MPVKDNLLLIGKLTIEFVATFSFLALINRNKERMDHFPSDDHYYYSSIKRRIMILNFISV